MSDTAAASACNWTTGPRTDREHLERVQKARDALNIAIREAAGAGLCVTAKVKTHEADSFTSEDYPQVVECRVMRPIRTKQGSS